MTETVKQQIAKTEAKLARLKDRERKLENGQKIVIGGMSLAIARKNPSRAKQLLADIEQEITRKTDLDRLEPIIKQLKELISKQESQQPAQPQELNY